MPGTRAAILAAGAAAVWFLVPTLRSIWPGRVPFITLPIAFAASVIAGTMVHEAGHVVSGLLVRFRPVLFIVGPVRFRRMPAGWRCDFARLGFVGGAAVSIPSGRTNLSHRLLTYIAGGAAANLLSALIAMPGASASSVAGVTAGVFAVTAILLSVIALVPASVAGLQTDGARLLMLYRGGAEADRWLAGIVVTGLSFEGVRPADWPAEWVERAIRTTNHSAASSMDEFQAAMTGYAVALDNEDLELAKDYLRRAGRTVPEIAPLAHPEYHLEAAFMAALAGEVAEADRHLSRVRGGLVRQASVLRARAAREAAAGNSEAARGLALEGIAAAEHDWDAGMLPVDLRWLNEYAGRLHHTPLR